MDERQKLQDIINIGKEAEFTFDGFYSTFHEGLVADLIAAYRQLADSDTEGMQLIKMQLRMADRFRDFLTDSIDSGKRAEKIMIDEEQRRL